MKSMKPLVFVLLAFYGILSMKEEAEENNFEFVENELDEKLKLIEPEIEKNKMVFFDENFVGDISECESQLKKFMNTLKPGGTSPLSSNEEYNNHFEFPNSETVIFHNENSRTGKRVKTCGTFTWKYKKFPLSLVFQNKRFILLYVVNAEKIREDKIHDDKDDGIIFFYHANDPNNDFMIRMRFKKIQFSNPPGFDIADANVSGLRITSGKVYRKPIVAADALEMFLHGLWCDVKRLEEEIRVKHLEEEKIIEEFKETLKPKSLLNTGKFVQLTYLTFPFNKTNEKTFIEFHTKQLVHGSVRYKTSMNWKAAKFPLAVKLADKVYVFQYHWATYQESIFVYQNQSEKLEISFDKMLLKHWKENSLASFAKRAKFFKCEKNFSMTCKKGKFSESADTDISLKEITEAFTEGFWCDVKRIENAVDNLQNTEIENDAERNELHAQMIEMQKREEQKKEDEKREQEKKEIERKECEKREFERLQRCQMLWTDEKWKIDKIDPKVIEIQKYCEKQQKEMRESAEKKQTQKWEIGNKNEENGEPKFEFMENAFYYELD